MAAAFKSETVFVRSCAKTYAGEIGFSPKAEEEMRSLGLHWPEVYQVLSSGHVVWSDKEEAEGAKSIVVGRACDGERLRLTVAWDFGCCHMLVVSVERL